MKRFSLIPLAIFTISLILTLPTQSFINNNKPNLTSQLNTTTDRSYRLPTVYIDQQVNAHKLIQSAVQSSNSQQAFQLFSHGKSGELLLEGEWKNQEQIANWLENHPSLQHNHQLNIYGCEFAKGVKGAAAVNYLENKLGLCVAASDNLTGIKGDWTLEVGHAADVLDIVEYRYNLQCSCDEYIYLNERSNGGKVHKYRVEANGSLTEIFASGDAWYPDGNTSELPDPHGLGTDLNGYLYIGESYAGGDVRKLTCSGDIFSESVFVAPNGFGTANMGSVGNTLYTNLLNSWDVCTGTSGDNVMLQGNGTGENWGFYVDKNTEQFYTTYSSSSGSSTGMIWRFTADDYGSGIAVPPLVTRTQLDAMVSGIDVALHGDHVRGITTDPAGNIYIGVFNMDTSDPNVVVGTYIIKLDANGNYINHVYDDTDGDGGWFLAASIAYSETSDRIYVSTQSTVDDCIAYFDTDLTYLRPAVSASGDSGQGQTGFSWAKAMSILKECCPTPTTQTINQVYCPTGNSNQLFLNDLFPCEGIICGGGWTGADAASSAIYNDCNQSISSNVVPGCYSFVKDSNSPQCGTFQLNFNLEILTEPTTTISNAQSICAGSTPEPLNITTTSGSVQWQMSTISCTDGFSDISGATSLTYQPPSLSTTTYYRGIITNTANCSSGTCSFESDCIAIGMTTPSIICLPIQAIKNTN